MPTNLELLCDLTEKAAEIGFDRESGLLDELLALRAEVIAELSKQLEVSSEQKALLRRINQYDDVLLHHMESSRAKISSSLNKLAQSRVQMHSYEQTYEAGSYFFDKKK